MEFVVGRQPEARPVEERSAGPVGERDPASHNRCRNQPRPGGLLSHHRMSQVQKDQPVHCF